MMAASALVAPKAKAPVGDMGDWSAVPIDNLRGHFRSVGLKSLGIRKVAQNPDQPAPDNQQGRREDDSSPEKYGLNQPGHRVTFIGLILYVRREWGGELPAEVAWAQGEHECLSPP